MTHRVAAARCYADLRRPLQPRTIGFWSVGRLPARLVAPYIGSQIVGAVLASLALWLLLPEHRGLMGAHVPAIPAAPSVAMEPP